jgi:phytanoyl-CoA hydroxylase
METDTKLQFDGGDLDHAPDLYAEVAIAQPLDGFGALDAATLGQYRRDGYLAIENAFSPTEITGAIDAMDDLVMGRKEGYDGIVFESRARDILSTLSLGQRLDAVRKFMYFVDQDSRFRTIADHPDLRRVLQNLLGELPSLFQDMALIKPPRIGREKPWHQDHAYFDLPLGTRVVGVWIALDAATVENGCMRVLAGGHRDGPRLHFQRRDWQICDAEMTGCHPIAVPLRPGGLLLFDGLLPHGTPTNHSPLRRRALQFHYHGQSIKKVPSEERLAIFGSDGKNVSC